jgi:carbonic anhydrase/acetyltransferase-like protein (isoleucine patch superfamily)
MAARERLLPTELDFHPDCWMAPNAVAVGRVTIGRNSSVWYGCVLRGDLEPISVGEDTNIQDLTLVHVDKGHPVSIGDRVTIGHRCVIHGCRVGDDALVGMGAVLLTGSRIGRGALVAAGAVVREGFEVPDGAVAAGVPAKVRGEVDERMKARILEGVDDYLASAEGYRSGLLGGGEYDGRRRT